MLTGSADRILQEVPDDAVVLDVGGWADPFARADWVLDLMPYETRGLYARQGWTESRAELPERFSRDTWMQRDMCDRAPFPFDEHQIDFAVCSHTLEDVRDPVWVCSELARVAKAGYIEVPSRLEEQSWGVEGPFVGWGHHRWLIDVSVDTIEFVVKPHTLSGRPEYHFPAGFWDRLDAEARVQTLWWRDGFSARERIIVDERESDAYLREFVAAHRSGGPRRARLAPGRRWRR
jgi:hypothetical protein